MKNLILIVFGLIFLGGCHGSTNPIVEAVNSAGCDVETAITSGFGSQVVTMCQGTNATACGQAFQAALGNVNLCTTPVPAPSPAAAGSQASSTKTYSTVGSVTAADIAAAKQALGVAKLNQFGIVASVACPIGIDTVMGLLTSQIPAACGCTQSLTASALDQALTVACEGAIPL